MYVNEQNVSKHVIVIDPNIHKRANLTRDEFLKRVSTVKQIRSSFNDTFISFYISSLDEYCNLKKFHDIINTAFFDFKDYYCFTIAVEPKLYNWFRNTPYPILERQIVFWLASLYFFVPSKRHILHKQIYSLLFEEMLRLVDEYYNDFYLPDFQLLEERLFQQDDETIFDEESRCKVVYQEQCLKLYGTEPPEFLKSPFGYERLQDWGINDYYGFQFVQTYFSEKDWESIILKGERDDMIRAESDVDLWDKWKHTFSTYNQRENPVYSFFYAHDENRKLKKTRRETIPQQIQDKVWKRDEARCVKCGSNEKLEFDHIIPFAKGGSSTYRNLQLLCEPCNRKKSSKIGG